MGSTLRKFLPLKTLQWVEFSDLQRADMENVKDKEGISGWSY